MFALAVQHGVKSLRMFPRTPSKKAMEGGK